MESGGRPEFPEERDWRALAHLGADAASAPDVPGGRTARIGAALHAAPAAHAARTKPRLGRLQLIGVIVGVGAAAAAITIGALALRDNPPPARTFPAGPTADKITVSAPRLPGDTPKTVVTRP